MKEELIKDFSNRILGSIETKDNGDQVARDFGKRILGYYRKATDTTTDFYGRILSHGNTVISLIYKK